MTLSRRNLLLSAGAAVVGPVLPVKAWSPTMWGDAYGAGDYRAFGVGVIAYDNHLSEAGARRVNEWAYRAFSA